MGCIFSWPSGPIPSKNLFVYSGVHGNIQVTTFRLPTGSYVIVQANQTCSTL